MTAHRTRFHRLLKFVAVNLAVTCVLFIVLNLCSKLVLDYHHVIFDRIVAVFGGSPARDALSPNWMMNPNYTDKDRAAAIFNEFDELPTEYRAFVGWSRTPYQGRTVTVDASGDRVHERRDTSVAEPKAARFFGGSTMWGTGSDDDHTIPALFEAMNPDYRAYNHGETGFTSRQNLARLINLLNQDARWDLVVFYDGGNDVFALCRAGVTPNGSLREVQIRDRLQRSPIIQALHQVFLEHTVKLTSILRKKLGGSQRSAFDCASDPAKARAVASTLVNNWRIAHELTVSRGAQFLGILQPVAYVGNPRVDYLRNNLNAFGDLGKQFEAVYPIIRELAAQYDYMHDLSAAFDGDEYFYIDFCHVSLTATRRSPRPSGRNYRNPASANRNRRPASLRLFYRCHKPCG